MVFEEVISDHKQHPVVYLFYSGNYNDDTFQPLYVGSTIHPKSRRGHHINALRRGVHKNKRFQKWFDENGEEQLKYRILQFLSTYDNYRASRTVMRSEPDNGEYAQYIADNEQHFIQAYRSLGVFNHNDAIPSNIGSKHSPQAKDNQSRGVKSSYDQRLRQKRTEHNINRWSGKVLVFGDIHLDTTIIPRVEKIFIDGNYDRLIFVGDELDSFHINYKNAKVILNQLKSLKEKHNKLHRRFIWCAGNHTLSYLTNQHCSGFDPFTYHDIHDTLIDLVKNKYISSFYRYHDVLFSHAGFVNSWLNTINGKDKEEKLKILENRFYNLQFDDFQSVGFARGGVGYSPSCLWADKTELLDDYLRTGSFIWRQVVGHTPVKTIESYADGHLWFCDTFSTRPNAGRIGDQTVLEIVNGKEFNIINTDENNSNTTDIENTVS